MMLSFKAFAEDIELSDLFEKGAIDDAKGLNRRYPRIMLTIIHNYLQMA